MGSVSRAIDQRHIGGISRGSTPLQNSVEYSRTNWGEWASAFAHQHCVSGRSIHATATLRRCHEIGRGQGCRGGIGERDNR